MEHTAHTKGSFSEAFERALNKLEADAKAAGSDLTEICREARVSRTTPDRWRANPPATVSTMSRLQAIVASKLAKKA